MDSITSERLDQFKMHLAAQYQHKDGIIETQVEISVRGQRKVIPGQKICMTAYQPDFEEEASAGCCCFGRPSEKKLKVHIIKKFVASPLHFSGNQITPIVPPIVPSAPQAQSG